MALQVVKLLREAYGRVKRLLKKVFLTTMICSAPSCLTRYWFFFSNLFQHEKQLHALANALLERETLNADEINKVVHPYQEEPQFSFQDEEFALT